MVQSYFELESPFIITYLRKVKKNAVNAPQAQAARHCHKPSVVKVR